MVQGADGHRGHRTGGKQVDQESGPAVDLLVMLGHQGGADIDRNQGFFDLLFVFRGQGVGKGIVKQVAKDILFVNFFLLVGYMVGIEGFDAGQQFAVQALAGYYGNGKAVIGGNDDNRTVQGLGIGDDLSRTAQAVGWPAVPEGNQDVAVIDHVVAGSQVGLLSGQGQLVFILNLFLEMSWLQDNPAVGQVQQLFEFGCRVGIGKIIQVILFGQGQDGFQGCVGIAQNFPGHQPVRSFGQGGDNRKIDRGMGRIGKMIPGFFIKQLPEVFFKCLVDGGNQLGMVGKQTMPGDAKANGQRYLVRLAGALSHQINHY